MQNENRIYDAETVCDYILQIINGINHCHENNIIHLDIKSENILIFKNQSGTNIKMCDFDISQKV